MNALGAHESTSRSAERLPRAGAVVLTALILVIAERQSPRDLLLLNRFIPGSGWAEVCLLSAYAWWLCGTMLDARRSPVWRRRLWTLFSIVFFAQLLLGIAGVPHMLMSGALHLPVPALIAAAPLYRGEHFFMLILFASTVLLVGPAWCSHLCYIGAWDNIAGSRRPLPMRLPRWRHAARLAVFASVAAVALVFRWSGVPPWAAVLSAALFGMVGVAVMLLFSRRTGVMVHCTAFCPIGLAANWLGVLNPFRVKLSENCVGCMACARACRYDALHLEEIRDRAPNLSCTLCGDCIGACEHDAIAYRFWTWGSRSARTVFVTLIVSLHAVFLGVARI